MTSQLDHSIVCDHIVRFCITTHCSVFFGLAVLGQQRRHSPVLHKFFLQHVCQKHVARCHILQQIYSGLIRRDDMLLQHVQCVGQAILKFL